MPRTGKLEIRMILETGNYKVGSPITFTSNALNAQSYKWTFGDNTTSNEANPTKVYNNSGPFEVVLKAIGSGGSVGSKTTITISPATPPIDFNITGDNNYEAPCNISVTPTNTDKGMEHIWSWGDNNTTTTTTDPTIPTTKLYNQANIYQISLTVKVGSTIIGTATKSVTIKSPTSLKVTKAWIAGSEGDDEGLKSAVDKTGNIYVTGIFKGTCDFGPKSDGTYVSKKPDFVGGNPFFVAKYSNEGVLIWAIKYEDQTYAQSLVPKVIVIGNNNIVYVACNNFATNNKNTGSVIIPFDTDNGNKLPEKFFYEQSTKINGLAIDGNNNIIIGGTFKNNFDTKNYDNTNNVGFVMKYSSNFGNLWPAPRYFVGSNQNSSFVFTVGVANDNSIYFAGGLNGVSVINTPQPGLVANPVTTTGSNSVIGKLDVDGKPVWTRKDGIDNTNPFYDSYFYNIVTTSDNSVLVLLKLSNGIGINFGTNPIKNSRNSISSGDTFLVKYRSDGSVDFLNYASDEYGKDVAVSDITKDKDGNFWVVTGSNAITKLKNTGELILKEQLFIKTSDASINSITSDSNNNIFVVGTFASPIATANTIYTSRKKDIFVIRYGK